MNLKQAFNILGIREEDAPEDVKKAYRSKILQFHPDKNKSPDAAERFREIQAAYKYLQSSEDISDNGEVDDEYESYNDILKTFLATVFREESTPLVAKIIELICKKICLIIEHNVEHIIDYLRTINRDTLKLVYGVLVKYRTVLHLSSELIERISEIFKKGEEEDEYIVLNPDLEDLMSEENVYILKREDRSYLVPLWHHEMTFDHSVNGVDSECNNAAGAAPGKKVCAFTVKCFPVLPENMELDEWNNLTVRLQYYYAELWDREVVVEVGGRPFMIRGNTLRLTGEPQRVEYLDCGVPYNNSEDVLDASKKQSVVFIITIVIPRI